MTNSVQVGPHDITFLTDMGVLVDRVFADIDRAARRAWLECYIFNPGLLGDELVKRLAAAVARGVDVRLLYDPLGSQESPPEWLEGRRRRGIDARPYLPSSVPGVPGVPPSDHSRIILGDDAAYTGGAAWGDQWLPRERGGEQPEVCGDDLELPHARHVHGRPERAPRLASELGARQRARAHDAERPRADDRVAVVPVVDLARGGEVVGHLQAVGDFGGLIDAA